jgi:hypothetical protein
MNMGSKAMQFLKDLFETKDMPKHPDIKTRLLFLVITLFLLGLISFTTTDEVIPTNSQQANIFQNGILLVLLGSLLLEDKFTKPVDVIVNGIASTISLISVYGSTSGAWWWVVFTYCLVVLLLGGVCIVTGTTEHSTWNKVNNVSLILSKRYGSAHVIFSIVFLFSVFTFYPRDSKEALLLIAFWAGFISLLPLKIPHFAEHIWNTLHSQNLEAKPCGKVIRVDHPNIVKVQLDKDAKWSGYVFTVCLGDGIQYRVQPLYSQVQDQQVIGTGLLLSDEDEKLESCTEKGVVYPAGKKQKNPNLIGLVRENSTVEKIIFETWAPDKLKVGLLVECKINNNIVYYQVADGETHEEVVTKHEYGFQRVVAYQLGTWETDRNPVNGTGITGYFKRFEWLPEMNSSVFIADPEIQQKPTDGQMVLGKIPGSQIEVMCDIDVMISHHTAIFGVTGSGKTELAHRIIERAIENNVIGLSLAILWQGDKSPC